MDEDDTVFSTLFSSMIKSQNCLFVVIHQREK